MIMTTATFNEILNLVLPFGAGILLGGIFYGGLWWTIRKAVLSKHTAFWFLGSLIVRMSITLTGFYFASEGQWQRVLISIVGFALARMAVTRLTQEYNYASQS
jgi:F1F0 ATPase subunit 2